MREGFPANGRGRAETFRPMGLAPLFRRRDARVGRGWTHIWLVCHDVRVGDGWRLVARGLLCGDRAVGCGLDYVGRARRNLATRARSISVPSLDGVPGERKPVGYSPVRSYAPRSPEAQSPSIHVLFSSSNLTLVTTLVNQPRFQQLRKRTMKNSTPSPGYPLLGLTSPIPDPQGIPGLGSPGSAPDRCERAKGNSGGPTPATITQPRAAAARAKSPPRPRVAKHQISAKKGLLSATSVAFREIVRFLREGQDVTSPLFPLLSFSDRRPLTRSSVWVAASSSAPARRHWPGVRVGVGKLWVQNVLLWGGAVGRAVGRACLGYPCQTSLYFLSLERFVCLLILLFVAFSFELKLGAKTRGAREGTFSIGVGLVKGLG